MAASSIDGNEHLRPRQTAPPPVPAPMPKDVAIGKIVAALVSLDDELLGLDMDHSLRSQYQFIVRNWIVKEEGQVLEALLERVAQQDRAGTKARSVLNAIIHRME